MGHVLFKTFIVIFISIFITLPSLADQPEFTVKNYGFIHAKGLLVSKEHQNYMAALPKKSFVKALGPVPGKFSLRGIAGPVEDQGACGSCWDFALTTALRGTYMTGGVDSGRLSFNYLLNCAKTSYGCNGGYFTAADYLLNPLGAPSYGADGSYTATDGVCVKAPVTATSVAYHMLGTNGQNPSFQDIAYVIGVLHRPVVIDVAVDHNWENYYSGTYNWCANNPDEINHMVVIEGYSCEKSVDSSGNCVFDISGKLPNGVGTWTIRNSWGTSWGNKGYITTKATDKKGNRCNAVATDALYFDLQ